MKGFKSGGNLSIVSAVFGFLTILMIIYFYVLDSSTSFYNLGINDRIISLTFLVISQFILALLGVLGIIGGIFALKKNVGDGL
jgi:hypothetical protein